MTQPVLRILIPETETNFKSTPQPGNTTFTEAPDVVISDIYNTPGDYRFFGLAIGIFVILLGTAGNGVTVWAYRRNRNLQTSFNVLIANLCCVELLFSLVIIPLQLPGYIIQKSPYPDALCATIGYFYYSSMAASLQNLVAIAINRYVGIVGTKRYQQLFTGTRLRLWVISIWTIPPILFLPTVIGGLINWQSNSLRCSIGGSTNNAHTGIKIYNTALNVLYQAGSLIILCVLYTSIMRKVNQVQKKLKMHKKASFTSTLRKSSNKNKTTIVKNGYASSAATSCEEGVEDYRPSSLISGGFQFRPAKDAKTHDWESGSAHGSDHELTSLRSKQMSEKVASHSQASFATISDEPSPKPQKRMSLWRTLFKNKNEETGDIDLKGKSSDNVLNDSSVNSSIPDTAGAQTPEGATSPERDATVVILRNMDDVKKDMRRKKSLSAPTLPALEDIIQSRKNSAAVAQNVPEKVTEVNETELSPLHRAFTVGSKYKQRLPPSIQITHHNADIDVISSVNISNKLGGSADKPFHNSMPSLHPLIHEHHTRIGTIARKIRDHKSRKSRRSKSERSRQKQKALRKRHARERQLVYSSLTICIAFAVCILPTALLYLSQVIFGIQVEASIVLILGCISWLHAVTNPFIYGYMNHLYRKEYDHILRELELKIAACFK